MRIDVTIDSDQKEDCLQQIGIIADSYPYDDGLMTGYITSHRIHQKVHLCLESRFGKVTIVGLYNDDTELMPTVIKFDGIEAGQLNFHPRNAMGELDFDLFRKTLYAIANRAIQPQEPAESDTIKQALAKGKLSLPAKDQDGNDIMMDLTKTEEYLGDDF